MKLLVDGDVLAYRAAASCEISKRKSAEGITEPDPDYAAFGRMNDVMERMFNDLGTYDYEIWLSEGHNFRYDIWPYYKSNRENVERPAHLLAAREYLRERWGANDSDKLLEADDEIIIRHHPKKTIICSNDKDFAANANGVFYNFGLAPEHRLFEVSPRKQESNIIQQMLMGDKADWVLGPFGFGAVKTAQEAYKSMEGELPWPKVEELYLLKFGEEYGRHWYNLNSDLLLLLRTKDHLDVVYGRQKAGRYPPKEELERYQYERLPKSKKGDFTPISESQGQEPAKASSGENP